MTPTETNDLLLATQERLDRAERNLRLIAVLLVVEAVLLIALACVIFHNHHP